jgi:hypothetical protein
MEKAIREKGKKVTGDDDVPGDGIKIMTHLISSICVTGKWPKDV